MRALSYLKWRCLFLATGLVTPLFLLWPGRTVADPGTRRSAFSTLLAWITAVFGLTAAVGGLAACYYGQDGRIESAVAMLSNTVPLATLTLLTAQYWRGGTLPANRSNRVVTGIEMRLLGRLLDDDTEPFGPAPEAAPPQPQGPAVPAG